MLRAYPNPNSNTHSHFRTTVHCHVTVIVIFELLTHSTEQRTSQNSDTTKQIANSSQRCNAQAVAREITMKILGHCPVLRRLLESRCQKSRCKIQQTTTIQIMLTWCISMASRHKDSKVCFCVVNSAMIGVLVPWTITVTHKQ